MIKTIFDPIATGLRLAKVRGTHSQKEWAERFGLHQSDIPKLEKGQVKRLPTDFIVKLAVSENVDLFWLLTGEEPELVKISAKEQKLLAAIRKAAPHHREAIRALLKLKDEE